MNGLSMTTNLVSTLAPDNPSPHYEHRVRRAVFAAGTTVALVLIFVFDPNAALVYATNMFGALRAPGEPAFIAGHRGDRAHFPENTLPALQAVLESDFDFVETDVQLSSDGVPVIMHDESVERTTNGTGLVTELTLAQLKSLDAGAWYSKDFAGTQVPTLDEFFAILQSSKKKAMVELKGIWTPEQVHTVTDLVYARSVQSRVIFEAFDSLKKAAPLFPRVLIQRYLPSDPVALATRFGAIAVLTSPASLETHPDAVEKLHAAGLGVILYTLNKKGKWSDAIGMGIDGIITDKPSSLDNWLAKNAPGT
jgi:glycerophosphoryl diester phosphodiesterase